MVDTMFNRMERGLGSTDLSVPDIVAKTRGNPQDIMQMVMGGQISLTQGLLAKRMSDSVIAERAKAQANTPTVLQESFPEAAAMAGGLGGAPQAPAQSVSPSPTGGGLEGVPLPENMFAGPQGGVAAFAGGGGVDDFLTPKDVPIEEMMKMLPQRKTDAFDAYRQAMGQAYDPEANRKRAELAGLFASLGNIRPGTNPFQAFVQGISTTGGALLEAEEKGKEERMAQFKALAEMEGMENQFSQKDFEMAANLAAAKEGRLDNEAERRLQKQMADDKAAADRANLLTELASRERVAGMQARATVAAANARSGGEDDYYKIQTARTVADALRKEAEERVSRLEGFELIKRQDPARFNAVVDQATARLARQRYGETYPEMAKLVIDMYGGITPTAKERAATGGGAGGRSSDPLGIR